VERADRVLTLTFDVRNTRRLTRDMLLTMQGIAEISRDDDEIRPWSSRAAAQSSSRWAS